MQQIKGNKNAIEKIFDIFFMLYVVFVFCFNDSAEYIVFVYLAMIGCFGAAAWTFILNLKAMVFPKMLFLLILYGAYSYLSSLWGRANFFL